MRTAIALLASWIAALAVWVGFIEMTSSANWRGPADFVTPAVFLGAPLVIVVPLVHLPLLKWLSRRVVDGAARHLLIVATCGVLTIPVALWPVLIFGGSLRDLMSADGGHYAVLYSAFGLLFGLWYAAFRMPTRNAT